MDIKIKSEHIDIEKDNALNDNVMIKEEVELIIESDWLPTKFEDEEKEYYQEFVEESNQNMFHEAAVKNGSMCEQFTIEYLDESEYYSGEKCDNDEDADSERDDTSMKNDSEEEDNNYLEELESQEPTGEEDALGSEEFSKWIADNYISRKCPVCNEILTNYNAWRTHITMNHTESIEESESNYYFSSDNCGVCKKCNKEVVAQFSRYVHSAKHSEEDAAKFYINICKICNLSSTRSYVQKHILGEHPDVVKDFKTSGPLRKPECPICSNTYIKHSQLRYHFMIDHPHAYNEKLRYNCHICNNKLFSEEEEYLQHLIEKHELNSWRKLNYRKVFEDKEYIACTKCNTLFFKNDICKLVSHFLKHNNNFFWSCKFCCKKFNFKKPPVNHMCVEMVLFYKKQYNEEENSENIEWKRKKNLRRFEEHIAHVCPFCNKEFVKMVKWQHHLRTDHEINTLKGLEMKVIDNNSNKLSCVICHTEVANSPEQLHAHRFQHLPYHPYKCLFCSITLNNFKVAIDHVLKPCEDDKDTSGLVKKTNYPKYNIRSLLEVQCSFCNKQIIHDLKSVLKHYEDEHNSFEEFFIKNSDNSMSCKLCSKQFVQSLKNSSCLHLQQHFNEKTFKCKLCLQSYSTFAAFYHHFLKFHNVEPVNKQTNVEKVAETSCFALAKFSNKSHTLNQFSEFISYACPECNESVATQKNWHSHIRAQHNFFDESELYVKDANGSHKCPICHITLGKKNLPQQKHKLTHMPFKSFMCKLCYFRCNSLDVIYQHFRRRHFAQGKFECLVCAEVLQTEYERTEHLKKSHPREEWPDIMCLICYRILSNKHCLNKHMIIHNADRLRYACNICGSKIITLKDFNSHMDRHKKKGEMKELGDDITSQSSSKITHSDDTDNNNSSDKFEHTAESAFKHTKKRKSITKTSATKNKKVDK